MEVQPAAEPWEAWIERVGEPVVQPYPVGEAAVRYFLEAVEDANVAIDGSTVVPATFVNTASRIPNWRPPHESGVASYMQALSVPLDTDAAVNVSVAQSYHTPLRYGDRITTQSRIAAIEPKQSRLGAGFMITEEITHSNQDGEVVAVTRNTMFRYRKPGTST
jgi:hypothetical protein